MEKKLQRLGTGFFIFILFVFFQLSIAHAEDSDLTQTVSSDEINETNEAVVNIGHVDLGPRIVDGSWRALARDDSGETPVWRTLNKTVLAVTDAALLAAPENSDFDFMGSDRAGKKWWVVPQTENPNALWLGWNTQDPAVTEIVDRGVTMRLGPVEGPGKTWLFLQNGTFGKPLLLLDGQKSIPQDVWVDVNTHVHANWVFTEPGVYLVPVQFVAKTRDGEEVKSVDVIRFAVGDATNPETALKADATAIMEKLNENSVQENTVTENSAAGDPGSAKSSESTETASAGNSELPLLVIAIGVISGTVILTALVMLRRQRTISQEKEMAKEQFRAQIKH